MPVILKLEEYEADLVVDALMEGRIRLTKDWEDRWRSPGRGPFEDDLAHIDADIVAVADIREHLKEGIMVQHLCQNRALDPEKKVSVAWHHERGWLPSADFVEKQIEGATTQDQMSPSACTTLPDGYEVDADPFEITHPTEANKSVNNAIWSLITRNFSTVSEQEIQLAEKVMRSDPSVLGRIRSSVDDLQKAYADDDRFLKLLNDLGRRF